MKTEYKGYDIELIQSCDGSDDPRLWDNIGTMVCFHRRYDLGDETDLRASQFYGWADLRAHLEKDEVVVLPLFMHDHSGITINTTGFECRYDSGQIGYIYVSKEDLREIYGWKRVSPQREERVKELLRGEVKTYDQYLNGDVWGYEIYKDGQHIDGCHGHFGREHCEDEAKKVVDYWSSL